MHSMPNKTSPDVQRATFPARSAVLLLAAFCVAAPTVAATPDKSRPVGSRPVHGHDRIYRRQPHAPALPHGPEYGFLKHIPPNAIRMPGYIFVPGVGILGESCDLPTSACPNRYRDIQ
jgi:hypothetical protein